MTRLFHITTRAAWDAARAAGDYRAASLATEGFIHLSTETQWPRTLQRFFAGQRDLVLLAIDPAALRAAVRFEAADGEPFPHLYGPLNSDAVVEVVAL
jgi:uncharacterized protein (DUF952 family)|nr:DUF952 domain-containing protein [Kofleriaceae bacterium]